MPWTKIQADAAGGAYALAAQAGRTLSFRDALLEATKQALATDDRVFVIGEGVDDPGGVFGTTKGLVDEYGPERIQDMPIAENGLTGVAIGAAVAGMRPIFVHMRMDFLPMCFDQLVNHAAKWSYMTGGRVACPLVVRSIIGRGWGSAAQHSQGLHGLFLHVPGIKIAVPSTPYDAKGLLTAALADPNPVLIVEHRWIYDVKGTVPEDNYEVPLGKGAICRQGTDVTVVAISQMVHEAMKAAVVLEGEGVSVEVVDPRCLKPLDGKLILESVRKTGRLVVCDVACRTGGAAAEIISLAAEATDCPLRAPAKRVTFADTPTPCSFVLEQAYYPDEKDVAQAVREVLSAAERPSR